MEVTHSNKEKEALNSETFLFRKFHMDYELRTPYLDQVTALLLKLLIAIELHTAFLSQCTDHKSAGDRSRT